MCQRLVNNLLWCVGSARICRAIGTFARQVRAMGVRTGYTKAELDAYRTEVMTCRNILHAHLPREPLRGLELVCGCELCFEPDEYLRLARTPPCDFNRADVGRYFGGAGAVNAERTPEARTEALAILLHCLDALADAVLVRDTSKEGFYRRADWFIEPSYWHEPLYATGVMDDLPQRLASAVDGLLLALVHIAVARGSPRFEDCLIYLSRASGCFEPTLHAILADRPHKRLAFWVSVSGWSPNSPAGFENQGVSDFPRDFGFMAKPHIRLLEDALADPATERLLERFAYAARDEVWLAYLSRLVSWRENTVLRNKFSRARPVTE